MMDSAAVEQGAGAPLPQKKVTKAALEGGGAKGYAYLGVARALEELEFLKTIDTFAGSSAGAISALLLSTGLPVAELTSILKKANLTSMVYAETWYEKIYNFMYYGGLHQGAGFVEWFGQIIKQVTGSEDTTFAEWHALKEAQPDKNMKDIIIEACNMNKQFNEIFSYKTLYKDIKIKDAVRASMAFPGFFTPWKIKCPTSTGGEKEYIFQDGGIQANCPIGVFNLPDNQPNPEALAIWLAGQSMIDFIEKGTPLPDDKINHNYQLFEDGIEASLNAQTFAMCKSPYLKETILVSSLDVGTLDFNLSDAQKDALIKSGYDATMQYFGRALKPEPESDAAPTHPAMKDKVDEAALTAAMQKLALESGAPVGAANTADTSAYSLATTVLYPVTWLFGGGAAKGDASAHAHAPQQDGAVKPKPPH